MDARRPDGSREETLEAATADDVDGRVCDELREEALEMLEEEALEMLEEEALAAVDVDRIAAIPMVVKGDGFPGILNVSFFKQAQTPQQYAFPPQGITPTVAGSAR